MKNKEFLIELLLEIRSNGLNNSNILKIIEKNPPHYYLNLLGYKYDRDKNTLADSVNVAKILYTCFINKNIIENIFVSSFAKGWLLLLVSNICKRVYSLCNNFNQKKKLEDVFNNNNIKNIYLKTGKDISDWSMVAPFDIIIFTQMNKFNNTDLIKYLNKDSFILQPKSYDKNIKFIKLDKILKEENTSIDFNAISKSKIL